MVKAELTIESNKKNQLHIGLDLLRREDWTEDEFTIANSLQESLLLLVELMKESGLAKETKRVIINENK